MISSARKKRKKLKDREKELFANSPAPLSSNGNTFLYLADYLTKSDNGTIAAILPLVTATNASSLKIRRYLAAQFHVETIIASHDPERIYFSENTTIGEMLLICRRLRDSNGRRPPTRVVNLVVNPSTPAEASNVAHAIVDDTVASQNYGVVQSVPSKIVNQGDWGAVQFLSPHLRSRFVALKGRDMFDAVSLGNVSDIGPDGRGIRGNFIRSGLPNENAMVALWDHDTELTRSMAAKTDCQITPKQGKQKQCHSLWNKRGTLLLPARVRLNTVRTLSVRLEERALGSAWVPCKPRVPQSDIVKIEKALCVYLNSTLGILAMLGNRSNKIPSYPQFSMDDLRKLVVPDFAKIGDHAVVKMAYAYDVFADLAFKPLPEMDNCHVRCELDEAVCNALGVDAEEVGMIRRSLASEPSVTGRRYAGRI